jgi:hypothetical protein
MHRSGWRMCRKVIKDAKILLTSFVFVCIPSFHCRINVLIIFGAILVVRNQEHCAKSVVFNLFPPRTPRDIFHSTLYPQSCWCIIQVIHNYI